MEARRYIPNYTAADFDAWQGEWELWQGIPVSMSPSPSPRHQDVAGNLYALLKSGLADRAACRRRVRFELDWYVADDTVVRPDVMVNCGDGDGARITRPPVLVAEVLSPATADKDRTAKRDLYARTGVAYYLMLDPDAQRLVTLRRSDHGEYMPFDHGESIALDLGDGCRVSIPVARLWD